MTPNAPVLVAQLRGPSRVPDVGGWLDAVARAERAGIDAVILDAFPLDSTMLAALVAVRTASIGIVPVASATITEPFHVSTRLATIDFAGHGRAGWLATTTPAGEAAGAVTWDVPADVAADATEHVAAVRALWDSWEDGAEIRDAATARFLDRSKVRHVSFEGEHIAVRGPSITPRPPQGHPPILARDPAIGGVDMLIGAGGDERPWLADLTTAVASAEDIAGALDEGAAGAVIDGAADLEALAGELDRAGVREVTEPTPSTLRERFGLPPATNALAGRATA